MMSVKKISVRSFDNMKETSLPLERRGTTGSCWNTIPAFLCSVMVNSGEFISGGFISSISGSSPFNSSARVTSSPFSFTFFSSFSFTFAFLSVSSCWDFTILLFSLVAALRFDWDSFVSRWELTSVSCEITLLFCWLWTVLAPLLSSLGSLSSRQDSVWTSVVSVFPFALCLLFLPFEDLLVEWDDFFSVLKWRNHWISHTFFIFL